MPTRKGKLLLTCRNEQALEEMENNLRENDKITPMIIVNKRPPRMQKVIIFGAPAGGTR